MPPSSCWRGGCWARCRAIFTVDSFRVMVEKRHNALGKLVTVSEATVKVFIDGDASRSGRWRRATAR